MAPLIPDGVYKIRNGEFSDFTIDLLSASRYGPVVASTEGPWNRYNKWRIINVGSGGNQVIIENSVLRPGCYVSADQFEGASLVGSSNQLIWTIVKVDGGMYYLQSPDAVFVWDLPRGAQGENILLVHHTGQKNTKWTFDRVLG